MPSQTISGVLEVLDRRGGFLRDPARSFQPQASDAFVSSRLIQQFDLPVGARVWGPAESSRQGPELVDVESVCGLTPEAFRVRTPFPELLAVNPDRRFRLGNSGNPSMRIVDLFAPVG